MQVKDDSSHNHAVTVRHPGQGKNPSSLSLCVFSVEYSFFKLLEFVCPALPFSIASFFSGKDALHAETTLLIMLTVFL